MRVSRERRGSFVTVSLDTGNAMITYDLNESDSNCEIILSLQPRTSGGGGVSREEVMGLAAKDMEARLPTVFDPDDVYLRSATQC